MADGAGDKCSIRSNSRIVSLDPHDQGGKVVAVTQDGETITANNAVVSTGAWTNKVLESEQLPQLHLGIWQVQWAHYEVDNDVAASIPQAFHFRKEHEIDGGLYYAFPSSATESIINRGNHLLR